MENATQGTERKAQEAEHATRNAPARPPQCARSGKVRRSARQCKAMQCNANSLPAVPVRPAAITGANQHGKAPAGRDPSAQSGISILRKTLPARLHAWSLPGPALFSLAFLFAVTFTALLALPVRLSAPSPWRPAARRAHGPVRACCLDGARPTPFTPPPC